MKLLKGLLAGLFAVSAAQATETSAALDKADTEIAIRNHVWGGFATEADIHDIIGEEYLDPSELTEADRQWIRQETARLFAEKRKAEKSWPVETDVDRLEAAFDVLDEAGIIALHHAGTTQSDGMSDIAEEFHARQGDGPAARGWVFYHSQDVDGVLADGQLYLAFGAFADADRMAPVVAREIVSVLERHGLKARWDGDLGQRIVVAPVQWRKRSPAG